VHIYEHTVYKMKWCVAGLGKWDADVASIVELLKNPPFEPTN